MWTNAAGVQQCRHIPNLTGCFPTGFPIMALPYELRVLIWRHAACLRHAISTDLHEADLELCWYLDTPAVPVDRFSHALTSQWPSPGTAHLLATASPQCLCGHGWLPSNSIQSIRPESASGVVLVVCSMN